MQCVFVGIKIGVEQQVCLIEDLLDVMCVMSGKLCLICELFVLCVVLESVFNSVYMLVVECYIILYIIIELNDYEIDGDVDWVEQIVWNLLINVIKFMQEGGEVWLLVDLLGEVVCIVVCDNGCGIVLVFLLYLFDLFCQVDGVYMWCMGGFGLGLVLVKCLIELYGGCVYVCSEGEQ